jgi:hypothetical protein
MKKNLLSLLAFVLLLVFLVSPELGSQSGATAGLEVTNYFAQAQTFTNGIALSPLFTLSAPPVVSPYNLVLPGTTGLTGFYLCIGTTPGTWTYCGVPGTPTISRTPTNLSFGNVQTATTANLTTVLANTGNAQITFSSITLSGSGTFTKSTTCGGTLDPGVTCTVTIMFTPVAVTSYSGTLSIADNVAGSPQTVALTGSGIAAAGNVSVLVSWMASSSSNIQGYNVYRSTQSGGPYAKLNSTILPSLSYTDNTAANGTTYCYVITSYSSGYGIPESINSAETCLAIP